MRSLIVGLVVVAAVAAGARVPLVSAQSATVDYDTFKSKIQPIFLAKFDGYARCYVCHSQGTGFRLQRLTEGVTTWNEEQSRQNFQAVQRLVTPGNPLTSRLLLMPLGHEAGGTEFHPGGKRWTSQANAEWKTIADWIMGK
jgi:hypothetical protein